MLFCHNHCVNKKEPNPLSYSVIEASENTFVQFNSCMHLMHLATEC